MLLLLCVAVLAFGVCFAVMITGLRAIHDLIMIMMIAAVAVVCVAAVSVLRGVVRLGP